VGNQEPHKLRAGRKAPSGWARAPPVLNLFSGQGQLGLDPELEWKLPGRGSGTALMGEL
jgi:hypothetical protein